MLTERQIMTPLTTGKATKKIRWATRKMNLSGWWEHTGTMEIFNWKLNEEKVALNRHLAPSRRLDPFSLSLFFLCHFFSRRWRVAASLPVDLTIFCVDRLWSAVTKRWDNFGTRSCVSCVSHNATRAHRRSLFIFIKFDEKNRIHSENIRTGKRTVKMVWLFFFQASKPHNSTANTSKEITMANDLNVLEIGTKNNTWTESECNIIIFSWKFIRISRFCRVVKNVRPLLLAITFT